MAESADEKDTTPAAAADAPPAADALEPDPEAARAVYEEQLAVIEQRAQDEAEQKRKDAAKAAAADLKGRLRQRRTDGREAASVAAPKDAEAAAKEASVPGSDPRESVFDAAPGKSFADVVERQEALARGEFTDPPADAKPAQWFVVTDEADLLEVAAKLGLADHAELGAINGRHSSNYGVQRGERVVLPGHYTFVDIDGVVTEGEETAELAGAEPTA